MKRPRLHGASETLGDPWDRLEGPQDAKAIEDPVRYLLSGSPWGESVESRFMAVAHDTRFALGGLGTALESVRRDIDRSQSQAMHTGPTDTQEML